MVIHLAAILNIRQRILDVASVSEEIHPSDSQKFYFVTILPSLFWNCWLDSTVFPDRTSHHSHFKWLKRYSSCAFDCTDLNVNRVFKYLILFLWNIGLLYTTLLHQFISEICSNTYRRFTSVFSIGNYQIRNIQINSTKKFCSNTYLFIP